jgi:hypothetical protein
MKTSPLAALLAALTLSAAAQAHDVRVGAHLYFDNRYHHDRYYPGPGYYAPAVPSGALVIGAGPDRYWFHGGVWYRPWNGGFRVVLPPIGLVIPVLPGAYVTLNFGGVPWYYAGGVYYRQVPDGYVVSNPPPEAANAQPAPPPPPRKPDPIIYPRNGQNAQQTEADRQDCNRWATTQPSALNDASVFNRAVEACMDGKGYSMR